MTTKLFEKALDQLKRTLTDGPLDAQPFDIISLAQDRMLGRVTRWIGLPISSGLLVSPNNSRDRYKKSQPLGPSQGTCSERPRGSVERGIPPCSKRRATERR